jgi:hypothetical protein
MKANDIKILVWILMISILLSGCELGQFIGPTLTPTSTLTSTSISTPTLTSTPRPTNIPRPITVSPGEKYYNWGLEQSSAPYLVWGAQLRDIMEPTCDAFTCNGINYHDYDPNVWRFLGFGEYGAKTYSFDVNNDGNTGSSETLDTFVITFGRNKMGLDAITGTTPDGKTVAYGYLTDGQRTFSYMDSGGGICTTTLIDEGHSRIIHETPCGIVDPNVNGDRNYNISDNVGGMIFLFLDRAYNNQPLLTQKGYVLKDLTIVSAPRNVSMI